jgi:cell division septum initiation protein DivIVA
MEMTPDEVIDMIATLEQENKQLRARNERLQEVIDRIQELIESNK